MKRFVTAVVLSLTGLFAGAGVASADVIVAPGQFGHVCSGYQYAPGNSALYWQSCAWADNNEVYFTVHLGNASNYNWIPSRVNISYYKSGSYYLCAYITNYAVPAQSVRQTPSNACVLQRSRAAYQSVGYPSGGNAAISDTLQVQ
ncbi:hypothetical protein [Amycolatopsis solani]|uniref:hypothetical protein n=1 Tax=Amycolatopsis solani TaxID=3028615 RepID=UPI0025B15617|nr:hypothetical protein [Amycolatopsis sp. MEP2-6]